jgi:predicted dehydrogenase
MTTSHRGPLGVAVVGAGYWGPNLVRNFSASPDWRLRWVCDVDEGRARRVTRGVRGVRATSSLDDVLDDPRVAAVAIATPASTHCELGLAALESGRHVLLEKPLATTVVEGEKLLQAAADNGVVLMCDHTYCYTPAVRRIRQLVAAGELGEIQYVDSVRINLGLVQRDIDVLWDLAPHDLSILDYVLPEWSRPTSVAATGADPLGVGRACIGYLSMPLAGGGIAHAHVNWLSPTKIRSTILGGSKRMLVWDDLNPSQRLSMYDRGVDLGMAGLAGAAGTAGATGIAGMDGDALRDTLIRYRVGDMVAPALVETEALGTMVAELAAAIRERRPPATDGAAGLRVLRILEAASASLADGGVARTIDADLTGAAR